MTENSRNASASSSSSLNTNFPEAEDDQTIAQILAQEEENSLNNNATLGRRLSHLDSIPHTPRVVGNIPSVNDANLDHDRLSERLKTYGLEELQIEGDGNCQFRALADQLLRNPDYHKHIRKEIVKQILGTSCLSAVKDVRTLNYSTKRAAKALSTRDFQLKHFQKLYEGYVPMQYKSYMKKMARTGEWGDHVTLQAAADRFGAKICLVTSFRDSCYIEILPNSKNFSKELWLSFWSEVHYNSLYASGDVPTRKPKKKHWLF